MAIIAINKTHQSKVNKAYKFYRKYHDLVNQDDDFCLYSNELSKHNDKQEKAFNSYLENFEDLPKREQTNFFKQHKTIHGYA